MISASSQFRETCRRSADTVVSPLFDVSFCVSALNVSVSVQAKLVGTSTVADGEGIGDETGDAFNDTGFRVSNLARFDTYSQKHNS
jgi:hypothetical protein